MSSKIFQNIVKEKIDFFKFSFSNNSKSIFVNENTGKLIHPGEFGTFRENLFKNLIKLFTPYNFDISNGFLITDKGDISTQIDLIIYELNNTPFIKSNEDQKFFPVESVSSIIEIKSDLTKYDLKIALNKLANCKKLKSRITYPYVTNKSNHKFDTLINREDNIFSILVCNKLDFDFENLVNEFDELYDESIEQSYKHNLILSINDGLFAYYYENNNNKLIPHPKSFNSNLKNILSIPVNEYNHFNGLFHMYFNALSESSILSPEFMMYLEDEKINYNFLKQKI